jgi:hypothetical protein
MINKIKELDKSIAKSRAELNQILDDLMIVSISKLHPAQLDMLKKISSNPILMARMARKLDWDGVIEIKTYIDFLINQNGFTEDLHRGDLNDIRNEYVEYMRGR